MRVAFIGIIFLGGLMACQKQQESNEHDHPAEAAAADTTKKSIPREAHKQIGNAHLTIKYTAPGVRGRVIWGGLVPNNEVWVTGAHSATSLEINSGIQVSGTSIPAGKYAIFTIPGENKWTIIINKNWDQHLADEYDVKDDIVRVEVVPERLDSVQERLEYSISQEGERKGTISIAWEKVKVSLPFESD